MIFLRGSFCLSTVLPSVAAAGMLATVQFQNLAFDTISLFHKELGSVAYR